MFTLLSPIAFSLGPVSVRWYGLMYVFGYLFCYCFFRYVLIPRKEFPFTKEQLPDLFFAGFLGMFLGARIFYMFVYGWAQLSTDPWSILRVWEGGLSFHGGLLGMIAVLYWFVKRNNVKPLYFADRLILPIPFALMLGRFGNYINGELFGRVVDPKDFSLCQYFEHGGDACRYPSQLFEACGEGLLLFIILQMLWWFTHSRKVEGRIFGGFLFSYGIIRMLLEGFREPDIQIGFLFGHTTMGQLLSLPLLLFGLILIFGIGRLKRVFFRS